MQRAVESRSPAAVRVAEEDEEARIRLLRGHAHAACLSYERAVADFSDGVCLCLHAPLLCCAL